MAYNMHMGEVITLSNGALQDASTGKIVSMQKGNTEHSRAMARARWDKAAAAARAAMAESVASSGVVTADVRKSPVKAWGQIVGHAAELAMMSDSARGMSDLASFVGKATGMLPSGKESDDPAPGTVRLSADVSADTLLDMLARVRAENERRNGFDNNTYLNQDAADGGGDG